MKRLLSLVAFFATLHASAQQVNPVPDYVFRNQMSVGRGTVTDTAAYFSIGPRYGANKGFMPPIVGDTATFSSGKRNGLLIFSVQKNKFLYWDSVRVQWSDMAGSSGAYIVAGDTAAMLLPYLRKADTTAMLSPYYRSATATASLALKVNISDTATMLGNYVRHAGYGLTKSGQSFLVDTLNISTRAWRQKGIDSVRALISAGTIGGSGTTNYVPKFTASTTIGNSQIFDNGSGVGIGTTSPLNVYTRLHLTRAGYVQQVLENTANSILGEVSLYDASDPMSIGTLTNHFINFKTNSNERLRIFANGRIGVNTTTDAGYQFDINGTLRSVNGANFATTSGSVGIGTASPAYKLDVNGSIYGLQLSTGSLAEAGGLMRFNNASGNANSRSWRLANDVVAYGDFSIGQSTTQTGSTFDNTRFYISGSGNVGIGTTSPTSILQANGTITAGVSGGSNGSFDIKRGSDGLSVANYSINTTNSLAKLSTAYTFLTFETEGTERMRLSGGNVGIGTASPTNAKLVVEGSSAGTIGAIMSTDVASTTSFLRMVGDVGSQNLINWQTGTALRFATSTQAYGTFAEHARINSNGELLINTTSDAGDYKLQVAGNSYVTGNLDVSSGQNVKIGAGVNTANGNGLRIDNAENSSYLTLYPMGSSGFGVGGWANSAVLESVSTNGSLVFSAFNNNVIFQTNGRTERGRINSAGEWLLNSDGTDAGDYKLQVVGKARIGTGVLDIAANDVYGITTSRSGTSVIAHQIYNSNGILYLGAENSTGGGIFTGSSAYAAVIGSGANYPLQFATNNVTRATIDTDGDLGIATTTPTEKLDVNGRARIRTIDSTSTAINLLYADVNGVIKKAPVSASGISGSGTTNYLPKFTGSTTLGNSVLYEASSELFINTTSDQGAYALQVNGSIYNTGQVTRGIINVIGTGAQIATDSTTNLSPLFLSSQSLSGASAQPLIYGNSTWNTSGAPSLIDIYLTNIASSANANYIKITDGNNEFRVTKAAEVVTAAPTGGSIRKWKLGEAATVSPTSPNRTIRVEIDGTVYYLHAKTTND